MSQHPIPDGAVFVSIEQAAERLGLSTWTVRNRIADGSLKPYRVRNGRSIRMRLTDVDALLVAYPTGGDPNAAA